MAGIEVSPVEEATVAPALEILGEHPLAKDRHGKLISRIATAFPLGNILVTLPGIHATQRMAYVEALNQRRLERGLEPLTRDEVSACWNEAVDLVMEDDAILIRPDPENMGLAFRADDLLQELVPKYKIKFLHALNSRVRQAIKQRGECWRITPLPKSAAEMTRMILASRIGIGGREIYFHNRTSGTRLLTCPQFAELGSLGDSELRQHLIEIRDYSARTNAHGNPEIDFFMADTSFSHAALAGLDFAAMDPPSLRGAFEGLRQRFQDAVRPEIRQDNPGDAVWRNQMFTALIGERDEVISEETLLGLSPEFFMQIDWLPGGRIENGELIFDPVFDQVDDHAEDEELRRLLDEKPRKFIFNFVREYGDLEYVNIGRVIGSLSRRPAFYGRRDVYIAELKQRDSDRPIISIIRMQKWAVREHLNGGRNLLDAMIQSEEYTEYILDRRLGCRQLGMNLPTRVTAKKISETYIPPNSPNAFVIWTPYFERDYIRGIATDKLPNYRLAGEEFALRLARLLGRAAAPNMIVGRCDRGGNALFDDGDEVVLEDGRGLPAEIVVADHTGTFADYLDDLETFARDYAAPVNRRAEHVSDPERFAGEYLDAFIERFVEIQQEYRRRKRAFDTLFKHRRRDEAGSLAYRWERVLARLNRTDPHQLAALIRKHLAPAP